MTLQDYLKVLREQWTVVVVAVVLGLAGAAAAFLLRPVEYTATLTMYVYAQTDDSPGAAFQGAQLAQQRVVSYVELVSSTRVGREVIEQLGLPDRPEEIAGRIAATSVLESALIDVAVTDRSAQEATDIANAVGEVFTALVDELEQPASLDGVAPVAVRVIQPAAVPVVPSSSGLPLTLAIGLLSGLAVGVGGAMTRNALDRTVKSPDQLREATGAPNLATIAFDAAVPKRPLIVHEDPQSPRAEAFRQLRTNLRFVGADELHKVVVVTSSLPGEGKTTTLCNLAIAMASAGSRVLVIDGDLRNPTLADLLGLEHSVGLTSVLAGRVHVAQAIQPWSDGVFDVLTSGPPSPNPSELLASTHMKVLLSRLRNAYDAVLIDSTPLLPVTDTAAVAPATDGVILACRFQETARDQVRSAAAALHAVSAPILGTVFTMVPRTGPRAYAQNNASFSTQQRTSPTSPAVWTPRAPASPSRVPASNGRRPSPTPRAPVDPPEKPIDMTSADATEHGNRQSPKSHDTLSN